MFNGPLSVDLTREISEALQPRKIDIPIEQSCRAGRSASKARKLPNRALENEGAAGAAPYGMDWKENGMTTDMPGEPVSVLAGLVPKVDPVIASGCRRYRDPHIR